MRKVLVKFLNICIFLALIFSFGYLRAEREIGLIPTVRGLGHAEAMTSYARETDALYYNPAGLAHNSIDLGLLVLIFTSTQIVLIS